MTFQEAKIYGEKKLAQSQIEEYRFDAWYLLNYASGLTNAQYLLHQREPMDVGIWENYDRLLDARCSHIPLQHLTGEQEFYGLPFQVDRRVLIPRQDTEVLVEEAKRRLVPGMRVLDLCTGSGCILLSLLYGRNDIPGIGTDISAEALEVAKTNSERLGVDVCWQQGDLFEQVEGQFDLIVSNPPYIPTEVIDGLMPEVRDYEPLSALDGGTDGLDFYRRIGAEAGSYLTPGGWLYLEIGYDQGGAVSSLLKEHNYEEVRVIKDLAGLDRVVCGRLKEEL